MELDVVKYPEKILRNKSVQVENIDGELVNLISNMAETMHNAPGIGLAAPQVGVNKCIIIVDITLGEDKSKLIKLFNPVVMESYGSELGEEGCLSIPGEFAYIKRATEVCVKGINVEGDEVTIEAKDLLARVLQHEIDHLSGVLFIDRLPMIKRELLKKHIKKRIANNEY